ncbi:MAG: hypothetical protein ACI4Q4_10035 [Oscillospiraceae bacterium]
MIEDFLDILNKRHIIYMRDGFITLPAGHIFATWRIVKRKADGADGYNMFWRTVYEVRIFYRNSKTATDIAIEKDMEDDMRGFDNLECEYDYDSDNKLDITIYRFSADIDF